LKKQIFRGLNNTHAAQTTLLGDPVRALEMTEKIKELYGTTEVAPWRKTAIAQEFSASAVAAV
jgi:hypothetical protein